MTVGSSNSSSRNGQRLITFTGSLW